MDQKIKALRAELDQIILEIGRARAGGGGDIAVLRERRQDLELEINELAAESTYRKKEAMEAEKKAHQAAIAGTLKEFYSQTERFERAFSFVDSARKNLENAVQEFDQAVSTFLSSGNPLQILSSVWNEIPIEKQSEILDRAHEIYGQNIPMIDTAQTCDRLTSRFMLLSKSAWKFKVKELVSSSPQRSGGVRVTKSNPVFVSPAKAQEQNAQNKKRAQVTPEKRNLNKPLIPTKKQGAAKFGQGQL